MIKTSLQRRMITLGGGGFSDEPENLLLDQYFFSLSEVKRPKVCFVPTASGDAQSYIDLFYENMKKHEVIPSHLSLFNGPVGSLRDFILEKDVIYVGGGNTRNLLVLWKEWGVDQLLYEAYLLGKVVGGISAGAICWYQEGVTDSIPGQLNGLSGLGILKGSYCSHYDSNKSRQPAYHRLIQQGMHDGIACDDGVAAVFENEQFVEFVSSRPKAMGYFVQKVGDKIQEQVIKPRFLKLMSQ